MPAKSNKPGQFVLPPDYTFTPGGILIHKDSFKRILKLMEQANNRFPDRFHMYIYNDFFGYGVLELVHSTLNSIHTYVVRKKWLNAWRALDALAKFNWMCDDWTNVDDGKSVKLTEKAYGALLVTTIRALDAEGLLDGTIILDLPYCLEDMYLWAEMMADTLECCYHKVLKGYAKKILGKRTKRERERFSAAVTSAYETFVRKLSPEEREKRGDDVGDQAEDADTEDDENEGQEEKRTKRAKLWYADGNVKDADLKHPSFQLSTVWKKYKSYRSECPRVPFYGPPIWDLTKWTTAQKKPFLL